MSNGSQQTFNVKLAPGIAVTGGGSQTPWLSNIDGAFYTLTNASLIRASGQAAQFPALTGAGVEISCSDPFFGGSVNAVDRTGGYTTIPLNVQASHIAIDALVGVGFGFGQSPQFQLDVSGDVNCRGQYLVNGTPMAVVTLDEATNEIVIQAHRRDGSPVAVRLTIGGWQ